MATHFNLKAQGAGTINGFSHTPVNPTTSDSITFYVEVTFNSGGCQPDTKGITVNGTSVNASALHCIGMLTVICNYTDTFSIGPQAAGNYNFNMALSSGAGLSPCSPGIVPDDTKNYSFTVSSLTDSEVIKTHNPLKIFPNPATDFVYFESCNNFLHLCIYNMTGQKVIEETFNTKRIQLNTKNLQRGLYFYSAETKTGEYTGKLILKQ